VDRPVRGSNRAGERSDELSSTLRELFAAGGHFQSYAYAYPHKTAYREINPARPLNQVWEHEDKEALFLYAHVPFCEMRCGFCNLFTMTHPGKNLVTAYLDAMERQAEAVAGALDHPARFSRLALGGGTPTFLSVTELNRLFGILNVNFLANSGAIPKAIEASPATVDDEKITYLKSQQVTRVSLGVQSFIEEEVRALGRAQRTHEVRRTLGLLSSASFDCLNVDLIYGIAGQTVQTWRRSLEEALEFAPQEIYLYPLYVRPLTHLDRFGSQYADDRIELYRCGRDFLLEQGYRAVSLRLFRKESYRPTEGPVYCCQEDGMVGLGPGARSYTRGLHYSTEYAVGRPGVLEVIADFNDRTCEQFTRADYGCELDWEEQKRRYVLKSLLRSDGLDLQAYRDVFDRNAISDFPQLVELVDEAFAVEIGERLVLNSAGMEMSDVIGPWLWSSAIRERMNGFALR
jgi:oxygen-independent coproporphyrinogen-3 oxidase